MRRRVARRKAFLQPRDLVEEFLCFPTVMRRGLLHFEHHGTRRLGLGQLALGDRLLNHAKLFETVAEGGRLICLCRRCGGGNPQATKSA